MLALKAENISKQYRLGQVGTGTLTHDLNRFWAQIRGKEDPYLKIGEANDRATKGDSEYVWSLRDINFEIEQGEAVGIIGRNGAGKSTLLKLLSKVTKPTTGKIYTNGRIASLLEVGTGFHPEMTGRENVFLNGAILGMTRKEITRKFDEIVDFSGVERYIDTPVKRYSSGMYVRLAFAVAAHLESEILIVDEVLAVGDAEFQKKCLGKMGDVSKGEGRTVLFVSHNMAAVSQLCQSGIYLKDGEILQHGNIKLITDSYLKNSQKGSAVFVAKEQRNEEISFKKITVFDKNHNQETSFNYDDEIIIEFEIDNLKKIQKANIFVTIQDALQTRVFSAETPLEINKNNYQLVIEPKFLSSGSYNITSFIHIPQLFRYDSVENICHFDVVDTGSSFTIHGGYHHGVVFGKFEWR